jgi:hypothetical protein
MSTLESKLNLLPRTFTPDPTDPNSPTFDPYFLAAVIARQRMTTDKNWTCGTFWEKRRLGSSPPTNDWQAFRSCWMGHLIHAFHGRVTFDGLSKGAPTFAKALGFSSEADLYDYNDSHPLPKVLQRFDEGLANWQTPNLS